MADQSVSNDKQCFGDEKANSNQDALDMEAMEMNISKLQIGEQVNTAMLGTDGEEMQLMRDVERVSNNFVNNNTCLTPDELERIETRRAYDRACVAWAKERPIIVGPCDRRSSDVIQTPPLVRSEAEIKELRRRIRAGWGMPPAKRYDSSKRCHSNRQTNNNADIDSETNVCDGETTGSS